MSSINKSMIQGRLGGKPEIRKTEGGTKVANFSIATSESYKPKGSDEYKEETTWHDVVAWAGKAEYVEKHFKKGDLVYVEGPTQQREYKDKEGVTRYPKEIKALKVMKVIWEKKQG